MAAAKYDMLIEQGATFSLALQLSTGGLVSEGGTPVDLTDYDVRMMIRKRYNTTPLLSLDSANSAPGLTGIVINDAVNGKITITITATDTAAITTWTGGIYDLEIESLTGFVRRLLQGKVTVSKEVTHA